MLTIKSSRIEARERMVPERDFNYLVGEHLIRYRFAEKIARGMVLDLGCGSGYGTQIMASQSQWSVGADISFQSVSYASKKYGARNAAYIVMDASRSSLRPKTFDVICAFEVIEHIRDHRKLLQEAEALLRDDGVFIISTPNKEKEHSDNPYHAVEFDCEEFKSLLEEFFGDVRLYGEVRKMSLIHNALRKADVFNLRKLLGDKIRNSVVQALKTTPFDRVTEEDFIITHDYARGHDIIGVCRK